MDHNRSGGECGVPSFLIAGHPTSSEYQHRLDTVKTVCKELKISLEDEKQKGRSMVLIFLGVLLDTDRLEAHLRPDKSVSLPN